MTAPGRGRAPKVDPRIRARRRDVRRRAARRRLCWVAAIGVVLGLAAVGVLLVRSPLLDVDRVAVQGALRTGNEAVVEASGVAPGDRLAGVPLGRVAARVGELPWVASASVSRTWPGTLRIRVVEREPVGAVPVAEGGWLLVDAGGRQVAVVTESPAGLARLEQAPVTAELGSSLPVDGGWGPLLDVAASMPERARGLVVALRPDGAGGVDGTVRFADGSEATLRLGAPDQLAAKWLALLSLAESVDLTGAAVVDVRVPAAPAVSR